MNRSRPSAVVKLPGETERSELYAEGVLPVHVAWTPTATPKGIKKSKKSTNIVNFVEPGRMCHYSISSVPRFQPSLKMTQKHQFFQKVKVPTLLFYANIYKIYFFWWNR